MIFREMRLQRRTPLEVEVGFETDAREFHENNDVPPGMGIRFEEMPATDLEVVQGFVARRAPLFFDDELP